MGLCRKCGKYNYKEPCGCKQFEVQQDYTFKSDGTGYEDGSEETTWGLTAEGAVERWAEESDSYGDYDILQRGEDNGVRVRVRPYGSEDEWQEFYVEGYSEPTYQARPWGDR